MAAKTDADLTIQAAVIRDETVDGANTELRVYQMFKDLIDSKPNTSIGRALVFIGDWDASGNLFPAAGSADGGGVLKGNLYRISVDGAPGGSSLSAGQIIMAAIDTPGQTLANWIPF